MRLVLLIFVLLAAAMAQQTVPMFSSATNGDGTYYGFTVGSSVGACSFGPNMPTWMRTFPKVAIRSAQYFGSEACGMCLSVTGGSTSAGADPWSDFTPITMVVMDECPDGGCGLDYATNPAGDGRWDISWTAVPCPTATIGSLTYMYEGSNAFYLKLQPRSYMVPIASMEAQFPDGTWHEGTRSQDNHFVWNGFGDWSGSFPGLPVRLTSVFDETISDTVSGGFENDVEKTGDGVQFTQGPSGSVTTSSGATGSVAPTPSAAPSTTVVVTLDVAVGTTVQSGMDILTVVNQIVDDAGVTSAVTNFAVTPTNGNTELVVSFDLATASDADAVRQALNNPTTASDLSSAACSPPCPVQGVVVGPSPSSSLSVRIAAAVGLLVATLILAL